jgi:centromeric protein E
MMEIVASDALIPLTYKLALCLYVYDISCLLQMEKEIKELKSQRDLAESRLQDLLQVVGDRDPKHQVYLLMHFCCYIY